MNSTPNTTVTVAQTGINFSTGASVTDTTPTARAAASFKELAEAIVRDGDTRRGVQVPQAPWVGDGAPVPFSEEAYTAHKALLKHWKKSKNLPWIAQPMGGDGTRKAVNALPWPVLMLDIDRITSGDGDHMALLTKLLVVLRSKVPCFGWSTLSHTAEAPALRLVIGLDSPVAKEEAVLLRDALMLNVANDLGVSVGGTMGHAIFVDPSMQDGAHIAFLPVGEYIVFGLSEAAGPMPVTAWLDHARRVKEQQGQQGQQVQPVRLPVSSAPSPSKVVPQTPELVSEVVATLRQLDQHCPTCVHTRRDWLKVLASLKAFGWDDAVMEPIAREWSQQSPRFDGETWSRDWYSLKADGAVTAATLYWMAGTPKGGNAADLSAFTAVGESPEGAHSAVYTLPKGAAALPLDSDDGAAQAFIAWLDGDAMFTRGAWHVFDGRRWLCDVGGFAMGARLKAFSEALFNEAQQWISTATRSGDARGAKAWAARQGTAFKLLGVKRQENILASAMVKLHRADAALDGNPDLLCVLNGVLNTRTGDFQPHGRGHMCSLIAGAAYDPDAQCPRFERFMHEVQPDVNVREFLQRFLGLCITGRMVEAICVWVGTGMNGKSVLGTVMAEILGEYGTSVDASLLTGRSVGRGRASPDVARLVGKRMAYANESDEADKLNTAAVKNLASKEKITARELYTRAFEFAPSAKIILRTNHKPSVSDMSDGAWRRLMVVEFAQNFAGREDTHLEGALLAEMPGILTWLVRGSMQVGVAGNLDCLQIPLSVSKANADYRAENDVVGDWMKDCTVKSVNGAATPTRLLFDNFEQEKGRGLMTMQAFTLHLARLNVRKSPSTSVRGYALTLKLGVAGHAPPTLGAFTSNGGSSGAALGGDINPFDGKPWPGGLQ